MPKTLTTAMLAAGVTSVVFAQTIALDSLKGLNLRQTKAEPGTYEGRCCLRILDEPNATESMAVLEEPEFGDGTIEVDVAGAPQAGARFECFYLWPTNGRADDPLRGNHSTLYVSASDYPWERLSKDRSLGNGRACL